MSDITFLIGENQFGLTCRADDGHLMTGLTDSAKLRKVEQPSHIQRCDNCIADIRKRYSPQEVEIAAHSPIHITVNRQNTSDYDATVKDLYAIIHRHISVVTSQHPDTLELLTEKPQYRETFFTLTPSLESSTT